MENFLLIRLVKAIKMNIEADFKSFLSSGKNLEYDSSKAEPGQLELCSFEELSSGVIWVAPEYKDGYYEIPAINLINKCDGYDPEFILLWLPNEKVYGTWDSDHWELTIFPNTSWSEIVDSPLEFINAMWHPNNFVVVKFSPKGYELKEGMPF